MLKTKVRVFLDALAAGDAAAAESRYREACKALDREADRGLIHRNAAARRKSRLARRLNALKRQKPSG